VSHFSPEQQSAKYQVNYDMDHYTYYDLHGENDHAYVHHFVISPLFQPYTKLVMKEVMRLMKKECLYHDIHPVYVTDPKVSILLILRFICGIIVFDPIWDL